MDTTTDYSDLEYLVFTHSEPEDAIYLIPGSQKHGNGNFRPNLTADRFGPPGAGNFPDFASSLTVSPSANPLRPTASWTGGDDSADAMIITYEKGDDEFTDGFEAPELNGTRTIGRDLEPGDYDVTLGFYFFFEPLSLSLTSGDDVLGVTQVDPVTVGETFSSTTVVPIPAAVWLFGTGLLGLFGIARKKTA